MYKSKDNNSYRKDGQVFIISLPKEFSNSLINFSNDRGGDSALHDSVIHLSETSMTLDTLNKVVKMCANNFYYHEFKVITIFVECLIFAFIYCRFLDVLRMIAIQLSKLY